MSNVKLFECFGVFDRHDIGQIGFVDLRFDHYSNNPGMPSLYPYHTISIYLVRIFGLYCYIKISTDCLGVCRLIGIMMAVLQEDVEEEHRGIISGVQNGVSTSFFQLIITKNYTADYMVKNLANYLDIL